MAFAIDKLAVVVHLGDTIAEGNSLSLCEDLLFLFECKREFLKLKKGTTAKGVAIVVHQSDLLTHGSKAYEKTACVGVVPALAHGF